MSGILPIGLALLCGMSPEPPSPLAAPRIPISGYVLDARSHSIRPIQGFPGSALFGEPLELQYSVSVVAFSPTGQFAVVSDGAESGGLNLILGLRNGPVVTAPIENVIGAIDLLAVSADGTTAAVLSRRSRQLQFVAGLPDRPLAETPIPLDQTPGDVTSMAIAGHGQQVALGYASDDAGSICLVDHLPGAVTHSIGSARRAVALAYGNDDRDLIYLDASLREVVRLRNIAGSGDREVLLSSEQGLKAPVALLLTGSMLWAADVRTEDSITTGYLVGFDLARNEMVAERVLPAVPSRLEALGRPGVVALNDLEAGPLYLFNLDDSSINFVPSIRSGN